MEAVYFFRSFDRRAYWVAVPGENRKQAYVIFENQYMMSLEEILKQLDTSEKMRTFANRTLNARVRPRQVYNVLRVFYELDPEDQAAIYQIMVDDFEDSSMTQQYESGRKLNEYDKEALGEERQRRAERIEQLVEILYGQDE